MWYTQLRVIFGCYRFDEWMVIMEYIDLKSYFSKLLKNWVIILLCGIIGASSAFIYSKFIATPMYASSAKMNIYDVTQSGASLTTVQVTYEMLENSLVVLKDDITFEAVAEIVNGEMGTNYTASQISRYVSYVRVGETFFFTVKVVTPDPELSAVICNAVIAIAPEIVVDYVANIPLLALNDAKVNYTPVSPNTSKNVILGLLIGLVLVCGVFFLIVYFDRTVSDEEKFKEKYNVPILGVIPNMNGIAPKRSVLK